jgi:hypothetical protein
MIPNSLKLEYEMYLKTRKIDASHMKEWTYEEWLEQYISRLRHDLNEMYKFKNSLKKFLK